MKKTNKTKTVGKTAEEITPEFFKRRFPEKDIEFEKKCGYFGTWVRRFESGEPECSMDSESEKVWKQMQGGEEDGK